jgi:HlyD family secretion protein
MQLRSLFTKKRVIWTSIIVVLVLLFVGYRYNKNKTAAISNIQTAVVQKQNIKLTVLATGQVVSGINLNLSFQGGGVVKQLLVKEGDKVKTGQTLAVLDQANARASFMSAEGALAQARANYQKVLAGASSEQINASQKAVDTAQTTLNNALINLSSVKAQQAVLVANAHRVLLNSTLQATAFRGSTPNATPPTITGTYTSVEEGAYYISQFGNAYSISGLETSLTKQITDTIPSPLGTKGLYIQFSSDTNSVSEIWQVVLPNPQASTYGTNFNTFNSTEQSAQLAIATAQAQVDSATTALAQAQANLEIQQAAARPADIAVANAQILSAQGQYATAAAVFNNTILKAPADGTITLVNTKVGEQVSALSPVMVLQDVGNLHAEANISEANVASLQIGQAVDYTFDALSPDQHFKGKVSIINPASTVISGVVNFKVTADFETIPEIRPGMTANMTVLAANKDNVLAVPSSALVNVDGKYSVRVIDDLTNKTYHSVNVLTGLEADGGMVEITSGLFEGQTIVTYIKL